VPSVLKVFEFLKPQLAKYVYLLDSFPAAAVIKRDTSYGAGAIQSDS
jgi:hypothetical protein